MATSAHTCVHHIAIVVIIIIIAIVLFHSITCYTDSLLSGILYYQASNFTLVDLLNITRSLVTADVTLGRLECSVIWILNGDCAQNLPPFTAPTSVHGSVEIITTILLSASMIGENRQLVTDEPVEFEK
jgi:hypothetical protein